VALGHFHYPRHFAVLAVTAVVLLALSRSGFLSEAMLPTFAISGVLHALALSAALREPVALLRKCSFVALAAVLAALTLYIGILSLELLAILPANARLYMTLAICSVAGAITYGSLIRLYWMRGFSSRFILAIGAGCALATFAAFFARRYFPFLAGWGLAAAWWCAFSGGLWYFDTRGQDRLILKKM
jgi:hypothetical protein